MRRGGWQTGSEDTMRERPGEPRQGRAGSTGSPADVPTSPEPTEALAALVAKLRAELSGVRTAMRNRAVIEQAKGVLVERLRVTPDQAFDQLVRLSQRANIKLIEVAAAIVGSTAPDPRAAAAVARELGPAGGATRPAGAGPAAASGQPRPGDPRGGRARPVSRPPAHEALQSQHHLISSRIAAAGSYDAIADGIATSASAWPEPSSVVITLLEADGALRLAGAWGLGPVERSEWSRVPPQVDVPIATVVAQREPLLLTDPAEVARRYPLLSAARHGTRSVFTAPLFAGDRLIGAVGVAWR